LIFNILIHGALEIQSYIGYNLGLGCIPTFCKNWVIPDTRMLKNTIFHLVFVKLISLTPPQPTCTSKRKEETYDEKI